jgi:hypothetical protein
MPPVGEITEKTDEDSRSNRRPIELIGSRPTSDPRSRIARPQSSKCDAAASCPHSIFAKNVFSFGARRLVLSYAVVVNRVPRGSRATVAARLIVQPVNPRLRKISVRQAHTLRDTRRHRYDMKGFRLNSAAPN